MNQVYAFTLTLIACILWVYGDTCIAFALEASETEKIHANNLWTICDAIAKSFTMLSLALLTTGCFREWAAFMFALSVNNLLDELFFDPTQIGVNEYVILIGLTIYYTFKITRNIYATPR